MTFEEFSATLSDHQPPPLSVYLQALWFDGKDDWDKAHETIQDVEDKTAAWIHAYLHRKEGDVFNANYWYNRAGKRMPGYGLQQEWQEMVNELLGGDN
ncbi:MAG TPA: hypothetical protein VGD17_01760 [Chitinophagaceae bacterium]